jgi:hypothetical protein
MPSTYSNDIKLELITTGEKAGLWGTITNTNLQILEQSSSGFLSLAVGAADVNLALDQGATSNGKNLFFDLTGTLTGNRVVTMPDSSERVFIVKDSTSRAANPYSLTVKTVSGTGISIPNNATIQLYSNGTNVSSGLISKGHISVATGTSYTAVNNDVVFCNTSGGVVTVTLPATPSTGDEVTFIDANRTFNTHNLTVARNGSNINGAGSDLTTGPVAVQGAAFTLIYSSDATAGWVYTNKLS